MIRSGPRLLIRRAEMGAAVALRQDYGAEDLRRFAGKVKDARQARRLLALAAIYDGIGHENPIAHQASSVRSSLGFYTFPKTSEAVGVDTFPRSHLARRHRPGRHDMTCKARPTSGTHLRRRCRSRQRLSGRQSHIQPPAYFGRRPQSQSNPRS